jgi:hypothetical protein
VMMLSLIPLGAGFLTVLFDDRRRGPHDMVAGTVATWAKPKEPGLAASPAPARESAWAAGPAGSAAVPPTAATFPPGVASPPPAAAAPPTPPPAPGPIPVVGEVVGPARDDQSNGSGPHAAGDRLGSTSDQPPSRHQPPSRRFRGRPRG